MSKNHHQQHLETVATAAEERPMKIGKGREPGDRKRDIEVLGYNVVVPAGALWVEWRRKLLERVALEDATRNQVGRLSRLLVARRRG